MISTVIPTENNFTSCKELHADNTLFYLVEATTKVIVLFSFRFLKSNPILNNYRSYMVIYDYRNTLFLVKVANRRTTQEKKYLDRVMWCSALEIHKQLILI